MAEAMKSDKQKMVAGLLAILLGSYAIHLFYLGFTDKAVKRLIISLVTCGIYGFIMGIIEGIGYLQNGGVDSEGKQLV